jgi:hypothetical protein
LESMNIAGECPKDWEEWVARCTAPGLKGDRAARRPYGSVTA